MDCLFCRIVADDLPSYRIAEDADTVAFLDINPATYGHVLVIPRRHSETVLDTHPDAMAAVARMVHTVATMIEAALHPDGLNIVQNNRPAAGQVVPHYHVHLIPRQTNDNAIRGWSHYPKEQLDFAALADQLRTAQENAYDNRGPGR